MNTRNEVLRQLVFEAQHQNLVINDERGAPVAIVLTVDRFNGLVQQNGPVPEPPPKKRETRGQRKARARQRAAEAKRQRRNRDALVPRWGR